METVGFIVTARVESSRIFQKVLQKIRGQYAIEILLDHIIQDKYPVVLAIPNNEDDDILETIGIDKGVDVYRGEDDSPLHRLYKCAEEYDFDYVVRITADDILIDSSVLYDQIKFALRGEWDREKKKYVGHEYVYLRRCPEGIAAEVIKTSVLKEIVSEVGDKSVEFVSYYIKGRYRTKEYYPRYEYQFPYRLTMDYPEDLMLLRILFASLPDGFGTLDFINFLKQHRYFLQINRLPTITVYTCNYNTAKYIVDTMNSVFAQDIEDYEFILVDDCSTDNSVEVITEYYSKLPLHYQSKMKILRNDSNKGLPTCCNDVLEMSRGKYIMRVDSDDILEPNALSSMLESIKLDEVQGVLSAYHVIDENDEVVDIEKENKWHPACSLLSRWCVNEIKYQTDLEYLEGVPFYEEFRDKYRIKFIEKPLWNYRQHGEQKTKQEGHPNNA